MRFSGGCLVEGRDWNLWYDWKISVGDGSLESRWCIWNTWDYWQTMGLGYHLIEFANGDVVEMSSYAPL